MNWWLNILALITAPLLGGLLTGIDRKITARLQGRKGPPVIQPFYDIIKLWSKDTTYTNRRQVFYIYAFLIWMAISLILLVSGQDFMVFIFTLAFAEVSLVLAGFATRSPFSHIGSSRELLQILAAEPVLLFTAYALYLENGSFLTAGVFINDRPLIASYPLLFLAVFLITTIKLRKSPFDLSSAAHAHQEIVRGVSTEFSGRYLALMEIGHWIEVVIMLLIVFLFWTRPWWIGLILALGTYFLELIIDNIYTRMNIRWMVGFAWSWGFALAVLNILFNIAMGLV